MSTVQIHLKEFFSSDSPETLASKLNFDFNQLLLLGIGKKGTLGNQGYEGAIGPIGPLGGIGQRGAFWFTGALVTPPTAASLGALVGDFYLNTQEAWQLLSDGVTWSPVLNFGSIINAYLSTSILTFNRQINATPSTNQFITFINADEAYNDRMPTLSGLTNDQLFLHNYNMLPLAINPADFYSALESIYVNHYTQSADQYVRHHIMLGSIYSDLGTPTPTTENQSYKTKFYIDTTSGVYIAKHAIAPIDSALSTEYTFDSGFKLITSKTSTSAPLTFQLGSQAAQTGLGLPLGLITVDGLVMSDSLQSFALGIDATGTLSVQGSGPTSPIAGFKVVLDSEPCIVQSQTGNGKLSVGRGTRQYANPNNPTLGLNVLGSFGTSITALYPITRNPSSVTLPYVETYAINDDDVTIAFFSTVEHSVPAGTYYPPSDLIGSTPLVKSIVFPTPDISQAGRILVIKNLNYNATWQLQLDFSTNTSALDENIFTYFVPSAPFTWLQSSLGSLLGPPISNSNYIVYPGESITIQCVGETSSDYYWVRVNQTIKSEPWKTILDSSYLYTFNQTTPPFTELFQNGEIVPKFASSDWNTTDSGIVFIHGQPVSVRKTFDNYVEIRGMMKYNGTTGSSTAFILPPGYRPALTRYFSGCTGVNSNISITVENNGILAVQNATLGLIHTIEIRYEAEL